MPGSGCSCRQLENNWGDLNVVMQSLSHCSNRSDEQIFDCWLTKFSDTLKRGLTAWLISMWSKTSNSGMWLFWKSEGISNSQLYEVHEMLVWDRWWAQLIQRQMFVSIPCLRSRDNVYGEIGGISKVFRSSCVLSSESHQTMSDCCRIYYHWFSCVKLGLAYG